MERACEIFTTTMSEKIEQNQTRRKKRLNVYALALTVLTIVSVIADTLNITEFSFNKGWGLVLKIAVLIVLSVILIYFILEGREK